MQCKPYTRRWCAAARRAGVAAVVVLAIAVVEGFAPPQSSALGEATLTSNHRGASTSVSFDDRNRVLVDGVPRVLLGGDDPRISRAAATALRWWRDLAGTDIVAADAQPMFGPEPASGYDHGAIARATARTRAAVGDARPVVAVLPFVPLSSLGRWPTRAELRSHAYMAIVEGARGLWWSSVGDVGCAHCADPTPHLDELRSVVGELAALEPALLADDTPAALAGNSNSNIKAKVKLVNGKGFVVAYNASGRRQSATFTWSSAPGTVTVHGEARSLVASDRSFSDTFAPFDAHVYVIGAAAAEAN
jgi:hypothetical protein